MIHIGYFHNWVHRLHVQLFLNGYGPVMRFVLQLLLLFSECPVETYSADVSNRPCEACPANSVATQTGLTVCPCIQDYYRAPNDWANVSCTREQLKHTYSNVYMQCAAGPSPILGG